MTTMAAIETVRERVQIEQVIGEHVPLTASSDFSGSLTGPCPPGSASACS